MVVDPPVVILNQVRNHFPDVSKRFNARFQAKAFRYKQWAVNALKFRHDLFCRIDRSSTIDGSAIAGQVKPEAADVGGRQLQ